MPSSTYTPIRPDGTPWSRAFLSEAAAWNVIIGGCNSKLERRIRRAEMVRDGWKVLRRPNPLIDAAVGD